MCTTLVLFVCSTLVLFVCTTNSHLGVTERGRVEEKCHIQILIFFSSFHTSCANRAQLATAWSTGGTCTVCGHPTMSNYFIMYLSDVHVYCLWPLPHILLVCPLCVDPY